LEVTKDIRSLSEDVVGQTNPFKIVAQVMREISSAFAAGIADNRHGSGRIQ
jgi:hypothetical protein